MVDEFAEDLGGGHIRGDVYFIWTVPAVAVPGPDRTIVAVGDFKRIFEGKPLVGVVEEDLYSLIT